MTTGDPLLNINFVKAIENRPCIWNITLSGYSKRNITEKAWKEVAEEVKDTVSNCRERWRKIRGSFLRSLKKLPSDSGTNAKKKYYLADYLEFILPYTKNKPSTSNLETLLESDDNSGEGNNNTQENTENQDPPSESRDDGISQDINNPNSTNKGASTTHANTVKKRKVIQTPSSVSNPADDSFVEWLKNKTKKDDCEKDEPIMSFFRSLLPDVRKMTDKQNRRFRLEVLELVDGILEDADIRPCSNCS